MMMALSRPLLTGMHQIIITCQITKHTLFVSSFWRPVSSFLIFSNLENLFPFSVPGYEIINSAYVYFPMTCIAGISFIFHVSHSANQLLPKKCQKVWIRTTHILLLAGIVFISLVGQNPPGGFVQKNL